VRLPGYMAAHGAWLGLGAYTGKHRGRHHKLDSIDAPDPHPLSAAVSSATESLLAQEMPFTMGAPGSRTHRPIDPTGPGKPGPL